MIRESKKDAFLTIPQQRIRAEVAAEQQEGEDPLFRQEELQRTQVTVEAAIY
jgi:hypothetical protein